MQHVLGAARGRRAARRSGRAWRARPRGRGPEPMRFVQRDAALGQRQRLLVAVPHHRDVGLVAADGREHVVGAGPATASRSACRSAAMRFVVAAQLRERDARQRVHEREVAPIAGGVQRRGRLGDVLAHDRDVADLAVALAELVVGEADGARVVRDLGLLQRAAVQRDGARLIAARRREAAVQPPERARGGAAATVRGRCRAARPSAAPAWSRSSCSSHASASIDAHARARRRASATSSAAPARASARPRRRGRARARPARAP